ncbi:MAG TPA: type II toxin-antitoxin system prevent-host-death family antitoxin [Candidatus Sumerlaeota bacterium]|nr:type II toxin-antitoxin system prevent-host-death family antitoxin [Candidatus Sumerlaeota bacterium]
MVQSVPLSNLKNDIDALAERASDGDTVLLEKQGTPVAAIVPIAVWNSYETGRLRFFQAMDRISESMKDVPEEEIERRIEQAIRDVRSQQ